MRASITQSRSPRPCGAGPSRSRSCRRSERGRPGPRPTLAEVGRGGGTVHDLVGGGRGGCRRTRFLWRGGQPDEVEAEPAQERLARGLGAEDPPSRAAQDERVDGALHPRRARDVQHGRPRRLHVGPVDGRIHRAEEGPAASSSPGRPRRRSRPPEHDLVGEAAAWACRARRGRRDAGRAGSPRCGQPRPRGPTCRRKDRGAAVEAQVALLLLRSVAGRAVHGGSARRRARRSRGDARRGRPPGRPPRATPDDHRHRGGHESRAHALLVTRTPGRFRRF